MSRERIKQELGEILTENQQHGIPENESNTCEQVVLPLLYQMGYSRREVRSRASDAAGKFPDYTLLPDSPHTWFLEAKSWKERLDPRDADQAINYAHRQGKRWVVLTNGRDWRLYDDHIQNVSNAERLVAEASIENEDEFLDLLEALSKESIVTGTIERSVVATQLRSVLEGQLTKKDSEVVKAVTKIIQRHPGMQAVRTADIAAYFAQRALAPIKQSPKRESMEKKPPTPKGSESEGNLVVRQVELTAHHRSTKPTRVIFGPEDSVEVTTWKGVAREVLQRVIDAQKLPELPFRIGRSKGFFLAQNPETMREGQPVGSIWLESHFSADDLMRNLINACDAGGFRWIDIRVDTVSS